MSTIAIDAMGADAGIAPIADGIAQLRQEGSDIEVVAVGDAMALKDALRERDALSDKTHLIDAPQTVTMQDKAGEALDRMPDCSIMRATRIVAQGQADALVSAGHTGAVIVAASRNFQRLSGVRRVGLAAVHPTIARHGPRQDPFALMLDVGATLHCKAEDLVAFAIMGSAYSTVISQIEKPRVALLSNGSEPQKGSEAIVEAHQQLSRLEGINFIGNVEGLDIPRGTADVVICEGFVGNIVLKMFEGVGEAALELAQKAYSMKLRYKIALGILATGIKKVRALTDWKQYGGAPIVGFDHTVIKAHGRSNGRAIRNAVKVAARTVEQDLTKRIALGLESIEPHEDE